MALDDLERDFELYVASRQQHLQRLAWALTGDWGKAQDLVQTTLINCWPHWRKICSRGSPEGYVRKSLVNAWLSSQRRRREHEIPVLTVPDRPTHPSDHDAALTLRSALLALPARQRATLVLRYFEDLTEAETAALMGCSIGTVKSQAAKALLRLRPLVNDVSEA